MSATERWIAAGDGVLVSVDRSRRRHGARWLMRLYGAHLAARVSGGRDNG